MVAKVAATSKCKEKTKEPILAKEPKETPLPYVPLYPPLTSAPSSTTWPSTLDGEAQEIVIPVKSGPEASGASTPLISLSPMDHIHTVIPPVLTSHLQLEASNQTL
jgi:hypothetical protein